MRTFINWNQPIFRFLFCVCFLVGYMMAAAYIALLTSHPQTRPENIIRPQPTVDLSRYPVKVSSDGIVTIKDFRFSPDSEIGPKQILSAALRKYPDAKQFKMEWSAGVGSSWSSDKVLYNRRMGILVFDEEGGQGDFYQEPVHSVSTGITDEIIHKAARRGNNRQSDGGFR